MESIEYKSHSCKRLKEFNKNNKGKVGIEIETGDDGRWYEVKAKFLSRGRVKVTVNNITECSLCQKKLTDRCPYCHHSLVHVLIKNN